ncbi:MarR family transcriptional regulator [Acrocarpospora sp. B8E8]|uniref:MarR family winged helix-turn-helix transcriptional regulator n=1 Tax=Acrocarpospora sp. B8E8 TaxID=3153572 RepID=UPI00325D9F5A
MDTPLRAYFDVLVRHETQLWTLVEQQLRQADGAVSLGRLEILRVIGSVDVCRVQDIADRLHITVGATSRLTDRLEADGLVARSPHPADRRSSKIELTASGRRAIEATEPLVDRALTELIGAVGGDGLAALTASLHHVNAFIAPATQKEKD